LEAAVLSLLLAEDWPWRRWELAARLRSPSELVGVCAARLRADGLVRDDDTRRGDNEVIRASWAAVRCDELLRCRPAPAGSARTNVEPNVRGAGAARLLERRHVNGGNSAPNR